MPAIILKMYVCCAPLYPPPSVFQVILIDVVAQSPILLFTVQIYWMEESHTLIFLNIVLYIFLLICGNFYLYYLSNTCQF